MEDNNAKQGMLVGEVSFNDGVYSITNDVLGIVVMGNSVEEAEQAFESSVEMLIDALAKDDAKLTPEALELKEKMRAYIKGQA